MASEVVAAAAAAESNNPNSSLGKDRNIHYTGTDEKGEGLGRATEQQGVAEAKEQQVGVAEEAEG